MISKHAPSLVRLSRNQRRAALALALVLSFTFSPACAPRSAVVPVPASAPGSSPVTLTVNADWDDLRPALDAALSRCSMATEATRLYRVREPTGDHSETIAAIDADRPTDYARLEADIVLIRGVTGSFTAVRLGDDTSKTDIALTCRIGTAGDPALEACLVDAVASRLRQLRGVQVAPLRWP